MSQIHSAGNDPNSFVIEFAHPLTGRTTVDASFLLVGASGVGHWQPPAFEVRGAGATRRRWAISTDPALESNFAAAGIDALRPEQFATAWGPGAAKPQVAWRGELANGGGMNTSILEPGLATRYLLVVLAGQKEISLRLSAEVTVSDGQKYEYRFHVPPQLKINRLLVRDQSAAHATRWARSQPDVVTVFLPSPVTGAHQLVLTGSLPTPSGGRFALPDFQVEKSLNDGVRALVLRRAEVRVEIVDPAGAIQVSNRDLAAAMTDAESNGLLEPADATKYRLVSALESAKSWSPTLLRIAPNQPRLDVAQLTTINRTADAWTATVDLECHLSQGLVDALRIDLPSNWIGPFEVAPPTPFSIDDSHRGKPPTTDFAAGSSVGGGKNSRRFAPANFRTIVGGRRSASGGAGCALRGRRAPDIVFPAAATMENQQLSWDTAGLVFKPLPNELAARAPDLSFYRSYQRIGQQARASLRSVDRSSENPQVRSVDIAYRWQRDGRTHRRGRLRLGTLGYDQLRIAIAAADPVDSSATRFRAGATYGVGQESLERLAGRQQVAAASGSDFHRSISKPAGRTARV